MTAPADGLTVTHGTDKRGAPMTQYTLALTNMPAMWGAVSIATYEDGTRKAFLAMSTTFFEFSDLERVQLLLDRMAAEARRLEAERE